MYSKEDIREQFILRNTVLERLEALVFDLSGFESVDACPEILDSVQEAVDDIKYIMPCDSTYDEHREHTCSRCQNLKADGSCPYASVCFVGHTWTSEAIEGKPSCFE